MPTAPMVSPSTGDGLACDNVEKPQERDEGDVERETRSVYGVGRPTLPGVLRRCLAIRTVTLIDNFPWKSKLDEVLAK